MTRLTLPDNANIARYAVGFIVGVLVGVVASPLIVHSLPYANR